MSLRLLIGGLGLLCLVVGCGHGKGAYVAPIPLSQVRPLRVLDLHTFTTFEAPEGFAPDATHLVFRRLVVGSTPVAESDTLLDDGQDNDVHATTPAKAPAVWMSVYELSQAQWNTLANDPANTPWENVVPASAGGNGTAKGPSMPAWGLDPISCKTVLDGWTSDHPTLALRLPTSDEWETAARSPHGAGRYGWGNNPNDYGSSALVGENSNGSGPRAITGGSQLGGYFNLHGNEWEWVSEGADYHLRGGSWSDGVRSAQCGNRRACSPDVSYALAGMRPVLVLP